ncbi:MAG: glycosyl hydrolase [Acidobacteriaceae bacterium]
MPTLVLVLPLLVSVHAQNLPQSPQVVTTPSSQPAQPQATKPGTTTAPLQQPQKRTKKPRGKGDVDLPTAVSPTTAPESTAGSEKPEAAPMSSGTFAGMKFRNIGPAFVSGRVQAFAVDPTNRAHYYVAVASGGVWKTMNGGVTYTPIFEGEGSYSIGDVKADPNDFNVVWVGSGEGNSQRSVSYGDGVYRSDDGGKSWKNVGLKHSEHIGRMAIDPRDSNTVFVAAQGPLWSPGGDRGLYRTRDAGKSWQRVLYISENTGVGEVQIDPANPDVMYAASYQRRRHVWTMIDGGPESAIYKSTDGGDTWRKLTSGLPTVDLGRIAIAVSPADPNVVYATVEAALGKGGVFRSSDKGATWERRNPYDDTAFYYSQVTADPKYVDRIYLMNIWMKVSDDGGKTFQKLGEKSKHSDNHVLWIDANDNNYYLNGCDGGVYESFDRGTNWRWANNLPVAQFYDVAVDNALPFYYVYGGTQDNNSVGGPSRTRTNSGIENADWFITQGGDGFHSVTDPEDANTVYAEYQFGNMTRYDRRNGNATGIQPQETKDGPPLRWNWDSPLVVSPHQHTRLYFGAQMLFESDDRGDTWRAISPDLTRQIDRDKLPVMGKIWGPDAVAKNNSTSFYGNIVALNESPKQAGRLFVGTDDGLIQTTDDDGKSWRKSAKFPGVPEMTYVSRLLASQFDPNVVYAAFDNHKNGDFKPYLLKSADKGATWTPIMSNLPENGSVLAIAEDYNDPNLLFVGTEYGVFFSNDGGKKWVQLKGDLPTIAVRDIAIQRRENDLVLATFGRGFYILDDYQALRSLTPAFGQRAALFPLRDTRLFIESNKNGGGKKAHFGESFYRADNPPFGATFTFYLKDKLKTLTEIRHEKEKAAEKGSGPYANAPYPSNGELRAEADEQAPALWLTIADAQGNVVRRISAPNAAGISRATWDLRMPSTRVREAGNQNENEEDDFDRDSGRLVAPGAYQVTLAQRYRGVWTDLARPVKFNVALLDDGTGATTARMSSADFAALADFQQKLMALDRAVNGALQHASASEKEMKSLETALRQTPADTTALLTRLQALQARHRNVMIQLKGDHALRARQDLTPQSIDDRLGQIEAEEYFSTSKPTATHIASYDIAGTELKTVLNNMRGIESDLKALESDAQRAGAPYTPGQAVPDYH